MYVYSIVNVYSIDCLGPNISDVKYRAFYLYCNFFLQSRLRRRAGNFPDYWYMSHHSGKDCYHIRQYLKRKTRSPAGVTAGLDASGHDR